MANGQADEIPDIVFTGAESGDRAGFSIDGGGRMNEGASEDLVIGAPVSNLRWSDGKDDTLEWDSVAGAIEYHVYRDALTSLGFDHFGACQDLLDPNRADTELKDEDVPTPGDGFVYLITADDGTREGTMGLASATERTNHDACANR